MTYELNLNSNEINIMPASEVEEILQNVRTIILTQVGSCALYREFGVDADLLDSPLNAAQAKFTAKVATAINRFEPRAKLKKIVWLTTDAQDGKLQPLITLEILT